MMEVSATLSKAELLPLNTKLIFFHSGLEEHLGKLIQISSECKIKLEFNLAECNQPFSYWGDALFPHYGNEAITAKTQIFRAWGL